MKNEQEKNVELGDKLYDKFVKKISPIFGGTPTMTPRSCTLEIFAALHKMQKKQVLNVLMMEEFLDNFEKPKFTIKENRLYTIDEILHRYK